jgi:hypothetical protein
LEDLKDEIKVYCERGRKIYSLENRFGSIYEKAQIRYTGVVYGQKPLL